MSDEELRANALNPTSPFQSAAIREQEKRMAERHHQEALNAMGALKGSVQQLENPHWTLTPTFWVSFVILLVAVLSWLFPREPKKGKEQLPAVQHAGSNQSTVPYISMPQPNEAPRRPKLPTGE